jgi:hypothetical protein
MKSLWIFMTMTLVLATACVLTAASSGEQTATYAAGQEKKHIFLAEVRENVDVLHSCLSTHYRPSAQPDLTAVSPNISTLVPSASMIASPIQPDQTAIAASPYQEITTASEEKKQSQP